MRGLNIFTLAALGALLDVEGIPRPKRVLAYSLYPDIEVRNGIVMRCSSTRRLGLYYEASCHVVDLSTKQITLTGHRMICYNEVFSAEVASMGTRLGTAIMRKVLSRGDEYSNNAYDASLCYSMILRCLRTGSSLREAYPLHSDHTYKQAVEHTHA